MWAALQPNNEFMTKSRNKVDWITERLLRCNCSVGDDNDFLQDSVPQMPCEPKCYVHRDEDGNIRPCSGEDAEDSDVFFENGDGVVMHLGDLLGSAGFGPPTGGLREPTSSFSNIELELEELMENSGDVFDRSGLEIRHHHDDHYFINDRSVRLLVLTRSAAKLDLDHYPKILGKFAKEMNNIILVQDGPMWQPLVDYVLQTGMNELYDFCGTQNPVEVVGAARNFSFEPSTALEDRFAAMRFATAEANIRISVANNEKGYRLGQKLRTGPSRHSKGSVFASRNAFASQGGA